MRNAQTLTQCKDDIIGLFFITNKERTQKNARDITQDNGINSHL